LLSFFPLEEGKDNRVYVEAVRINGEEDAIEKFYRSWKAWERGPAIIIQKYDSFCGFLPQKMPVDLSPVERRPCWHLLRDSPILLDGTVLLCREEPGKNAAGNIFKEDPAAIWEKGKEDYLSHCKKDYKENCRVCDEYYTFNF
jgi:spiro-SPASM protein